MPTIAVYDLDIQKNRFGGGTFGRGFYVLDNYAPLRTLGSEILDKRAHLFDIKDALLYVPATPLGSRGTGWQGHSLWSAKNPSYGASFNLYLKDVVQSLKSKRQKRKRS